MPRSRALPRLVFPNRDSASNPHLWFPKSVWEPEVEWALSVVPVVALV